MLGKKRMKTNCTIVHNTDNKEMKPSLKISFTWFVSLVLTETGWPKINVIRIFDICSTRPKFQYESKFRQNICFNKRVKEFSRRRIKQSFSAIGSTAEPIYQNLWIECHWDCFKKQAVRWIGDFNNKRKLTNLTFEWLSVEINDIPTI